MRKRKYLSIGETQVFSPFFRSSSPYFLRDDLKMFFITNWMIVNQVGQIVCGPLVLHGPIMRWQSKHCCCWCCPLVIEEMIKQTVNLFSKSLIEGSSLPIPHEWRSFREHRSLHSILSNLMQSQEPSCNLLVPPEASYNLLKPPETSKDLLKPQKPPETSWNFWKPPETSCNILQHPATSCNLLQPPATSCNLLQPSATSCNLLQPSAISCNLLQAQNLFQPLEEPSLLQIITEIDNVRVYVPD